MFQVESRAQLATLPRLKPREFYDLVVEVALIRPGPIQGGSVHPYIRRRNGEAWTHAHPKLAGALDRTLGVPLFQEQVMQGAATNGITGQLADTIFGQIQAFSGYGFPEAHSMSFALYHPAGFCAGLLRAQPMGFYSPQSLVADARRHGVTILRPDINASLAHATLEPCPDSTSGVAVRLDLGTIRTIGTDAAQALVDERDTNGPYRDLKDLGRRTTLTPNLSSKHSPPADRSALSAPTAAKLSGRPARSHATDPTTCPAPPPRATPPLSPE